MGERFQDYAGRLRNRTAKKPKAEAENRIYAVRGAG